MLHNKKESAKTIPRQIGSYRKSSSTSKQARLPVKPTSIRKLVLDRTKMFSAKEEKPEESIVLPEIDFERAVISIKMSPPITAYALNTHKGLVRSANQDKITVVQNFLVAKKNYHFFGLYDGHGGSRVSEYLAKELHIIMAAHVEECVSLEQAVLESFRQVQNYWLNRPKRGHTEKSGSCALVVMVADTEAWIINLGDSRAIFIYQDGKVEQLTNDHRPGQKQQKRRIEGKGGLVYQLQEQQGENAPCRVMPGGLSVSRAIGDICSKVPEYGGKEGLIIAEPEINRVELSKQPVVMLLGCDGVFDSLTNEQVGEQIMIGMRQAGQASHRLGIGVDQILNKCMIQGSTDNLSVIALRLVRKQI